MALVSHLVGRTTQGHAALFHARERRRHAEDIKKFEGDVSSPFDMGTVAATNPLTTPYSMRANARIAVSFSAILTAGQLTLDLSGGRTLETPALAANEIYELDYLHRAQTVTPTSAIAGTITLYVLDEWTRPNAVATGVFT